MASYYSKIENKITQNEEVLAVIKNKIIDLNETKEKLKPHIYDEEITNLEQERSQIEKIIKENRELLRNFNKVANGIRRLKILGNMTSYNHLEYSDEKKEMIEKLKLEITESLNALPDELVEELQNINSKINKNSKTNNFTIKKNNSIENQPSSRLNSLEKTNEKLNRKLHQEKAYYKEAERDYNASLKRIQAIEKEQEELANNDKMISEEDLNELKKKYAIQKDAEKEKLQKATKEMHYARKKINEVNTRKHQYAEIENESTKLKISSANYQKIQMTISNDSMLTEIYKQHGVKNTDYKIQEIKEYEKEQNNSKEKINNNINILETDNLKSYLGSDNPVIFIDAKIISVSANFKKFIKNRVHNQPRKIPKNTEENQKIQPLPAPKDMLWGSQITFMEENPSKYSATNIRVTKKFKEELSTENNQYNIILNTPKITKLPIEFIQKIFNII